MTPGLPASAHIFETGPSYGERMRVGTLRFTIAVGLLSLASVLPVLAWGVEGHRMISRLAGLPSSGSTRIPLKCAGIGRVKLLLSASGSLARKRRTRARSGDRTGPFYSDGSAACTPSPAQKPVQLCPRAGPCANIPSGTRINCSENRHATLPSRRSPGTVKGSHARLQGSRGSQGSFGARSGRSYFHGRLAWSLRRRCCDAAIHFE